MWTPPIFLHPLRDHVNSAHVMSLFQPNTRLQTEVCCYCIRIRSASRDAGCNIFSSRSVGAMVHTGIIGQPGKCLAFQRRAQVCPDASARVPRAVAVPSQHSTCARQRQRPVCMGHSAGPAVRQPRHRGSPVVSRSSAASVAPAAPADEEPLPSGRNAVDSLLEEPRASSCIMHLLDNESSTLV